MWPDELSSTRAIAHISQKGTTMLGRAVVAAVLALALAAPVLADPQSPKIDRREHRQKHRIKEGVRSGELTKGEAKKLRAEQKDIRAKERAMKSDGVLTKEERKDLHQDLNESSKNIAEEKHDAEKR
jgi:septal ring factor EnvC (AmiA/AmiB activator)